jgi:hypothetical protein
MAAGKSPDSGNFWVLTDDSFPDGPARRTARNGLNAALILQQNRAKEQGRWALSVGKTALFLSHLRDGLRAAGLA